MALFCKEGRTDLIGQFSYAKPNPDTRKWLELFFQEIGLKTLGGQPFDWNRVETRKDKVYYLPPVTDDFRGLTFLRNGLYLGDLKKNRFEPSEPFALALRKDDTDGIISLSVNDQRLTRYLKGETLNIEPEEATHTKGLAPSLCRRLPSRFRQAGRQDLQKQISRRLESLTSCPARDFFAIVYRRGAGGASADLLSHILCHISDRDHFPKCK